MLQEKDEEVQHLRSTSLLIKMRFESMLFSFRRFDVSDDDFHFYAGFYDSASYREFMTFVMCHAGDMSYWSRTVHWTLPGVQDNTQTSNAS